MNKVFKLLPLLAAGVAFVGCQDEDLGYTAEEIKYKTEFAKTFGNVDPNQDWNLLAQLANSGAVTRAAGSTTTPTGEFKITVLPENQAAHIAPEKMKDYSKMLPESNVGNNPYYNSNLGRVTQNFSAITQKVVLYPVYWWTNATDEIGLYYYSNETGSTAVTGTDGSTYHVVRVPITTSRPEELEYSYEAAPVWTSFQNYNYESYMPDGYKQTLANANIGFKIAEGTEYNEYGQTGYITAGTLVKTETKSLGYESQAGPAGTNFEYCYAPSVFDIVTGISDIYPEKYRVDSNDNYKILTSAGGTTWEPAISQLTAGQDPEKVDSLIVSALESRPWTGKTVTGFRSKGIVVELPAAMKIGFYVKNGSNIMYSEGKLNHKKSWSDHPEEIDACYIATYESDEKDAMGNSVRYLAFEDWYNQGDYDLNDIVFRVYGLETVVDHEDIVEEGLFVCEDLGAFDFDFNDVVVKASWKRFYKKTYTKDSDGNVISVTIAQEPSDTLTITGMAAGGHNPSDVYFKTASNTSGKKLGEIHEILNSSAPNVINAGETYGSDGQSFGFTEAEFPAAWNETNYPNGYVSQMFGEGYLYVIASTTNRVNDPVQPDGAYNHEASHLISSTSYRTNGVPQMMLLPMYYEWCQEDQPIETVYPHFTDWVSDATKTGWLTNGKVEAKTTDRGVTPEMYIMPSVPSGDGGNGGGSESGPTQDPLITAGYTKLTQQNCVEGWKRGFDLSSLKAAITSGKVEIKFVASSWNQKCTVHLGDSKDVTTWINWDFENENDTTYSAIKSITELSTDYIYCCSANSEPVMYYKSVE